MGTIIKLREEKACYFKQLERYNGQTTNPSARGERGKLDIRQTQVNPTNMTKIVIEAISRAINLTGISDYNDPNTPIGPSKRYQLYQLLDGMRTSADTTFLSHDITTKMGEGVEGRQLTVSFESTETRIIFKQNRVFLIIQQR